MRYGWMLLGAAGFLGLAGCASERYEASTPAYYDYPPGYYPSGYYAPGYAYQPGYYYDRGYRTYVDPQRNWGHARAEHAWRERAMREQAMRERAAHEHHEAAEQRAQQYWQRASER